MLNRANICHWDVTYRVSHTRRSNLIKCVLGSEVFGKLTGLAIQKGLRILTNIRPSGVASLK